jgi:nucleolar MIF4G domain-containing protein 1
METAYHSLLALKMPSIPSVEKFQSRKERRKHERIAKKQQQHRTKSTKHVLKNVESEASPLAETEDREPKLSQHLTRTKGNIIDDSSSEKKVPPLPRKEATESILPTTNKCRDRNNSSPYQHLDPDIALALRRDDEEIAMLESKLNVSKDRDRLKREYSNLEGYGNDFGDFLDDLDLVVQGVVSQNDMSKRYKTLHPECSDEDDHPIDDESTDEIDDSDSSEEEIVPMKAPAFDDDIIESNWNHSADNNEDGDESLDEDVAELFNHSRNEESDDATPILDDSDDDFDGNKCGTFDFQEDEEMSDEGVDAKDEADHDVSDTYRPSVGEDIYGNSIPASNVDSTKPQKYVPPHLRKQSTNTASDPRKSLEHEGSDNEQRKETIRALQRSMNSILNRLSEGTIVSVVQLLVELYGSYPTADVNAALWDHTQHACVLQKSMIMTGLVPIYVATVVGVHVRKGDAAQLMEYLLENVVTRFWSQLQDVRTANESRSHRNHVDRTNSDDCDEISDESTLNKEICNLALILCYMYNFNVVHCTLLYDIIRDLIAHSHCDVELLLLIIHHCGRTLRTDDPAALKEIVSLVQQQSLDYSKSHPNQVSSRNQYMVSAMIDLKKHKRRKQDQKYVDVVVQLRKVLGHIKTSSHSKSNARSVASSDSSLRITLRDILDAPVKGRWWKVGASWSGGGGDADTTSERNHHHNLGSDAREEDLIDDKLLKLATKYRMNTDTRRTIFFIIMGSADYEDCFEKLVRAGMLKHRAERDTVRVLTECSSNEGTFNPFYAFLAARICTYQPQCKFSFQLAFWDMFKQMDEWNARKVANAAKLLFHLVAVHKCLKLNVIKALDIAAPEELSETVMIFVTIFLSNIMEHFENREDTVRLFEMASHKKDSHRDASEGEMYDGDGIQVSLTVFLMQVLKASPKNKKGSRFRANLKAAIQACNTDDFFGTN